MFKRLLPLFLVLCIAAGGAGAQTATPYQRPSEDIVAMLDAARLPQPHVSPDARWLLLAEQPPMPTIAELAQPMLRLGGTRISPRSNSLFNPSSVVKLSLVDVAGHNTREIALPANPRLSFITWSPDSRSFAFVNRAADELELWVGDAASAKVKRASSARLNSTTGEPYAWLPDSHGLICLTVRRDRGPEPSESPIPTGPKVQETSGGRAQTATYEDLLHDAHDEALFTYYFTSQLAHVDLVSGATRILGAPAIFDNLNVSPDGKYLFVARITPPFSYYVPYNDFPAELDILDRNGTTVRHVASLPLAEKTPIGGVRLGPRAIRWNPLQPATLVYVEALDGGDPKNKVANRDRVLEIEAPFAGEPHEWFKTELRCVGVDWTERGDLAIYREFDRRARKSRTYLLETKNGAAKPRLLFDLQSEDRYNNPGLLVMTANPAGKRVALQSADGNFVYLSGPGATQQGDRPFLRRLNLATFQTEEIFRSQDPFYESFVAPVDRDAARIITSRESNTEPANFVLRDLRRKDEVMLTRFTDPQPAFRKVKKELVTYSRSDGIKLSGTLYLPPNYRPGERLPTFIWAYPNEFASADAASQVSGSPNRFTRVTGASYLFMALKGYAVLDNAAMPILGGDKANDTFIEQLVMNAKAAIDFLVEKGVTDRDRVGVGGHSYGAFMTANLLAHSNLFRAGIARSGAYNRTLTPFSFQNEQRTLWEAPEVYLRISPFLSADKINAPILLFHGEADNNSGTFPIQSERLFHALRGLGKTARFVELPLEAHGYAGRESVLDTIAEMINWMDRYVKNAQPREAQATR